jgi:hypothetical protein
MPVVPQEDLAVVRQQAQRLFNGLLESDDRAVLSLLTQFLARLSEATTKEPATLRPLRHGSRSLRRDGVARLLPV